MWPLCKRLEVSPGFCLLAAWFALSSGWQALAVILLAAAGLAIRALVFMIGNIRTGLSMNFLEFSDFLPLVAGLGAGLAAFFLLHNVKAAFFLGAIAANIPLSSE